MLRAIRRFRCARHIAPLLCLGLAATFLTACSKNNNSTLNFYSFAEPSGAVAQAVKECSAAANGRYTIAYNKLPAAADAQRQQLVRRLAAKDKTLDILGLDVTWTAEFAEAQWIREWTDENKQRAQAGTLPAALNTATWQGKLFAVPYNTNTQLLWYRKDLVPHAPQTWSEMIGMAQELARQGRPHFIEVQGAQYEGLSVWFNTMVASAGGSILSPDGKAVQLGEPAQQALQVMAQMAQSPAADPSLSRTMENQARLAMESGSAAFEVNYPFVYPSMQQNQPELAKSFAWAPYPAVNADQPSRVTIGGIDLAVSAYSRHPAQAFEAALCLRNREHQLLAATKGGLPPTLTDLYTDPAMKKDYPFAADILTALNSASVRPQTPAYQTVSVVISQTLSPPSSISPSATQAKLRRDISDALQSKGLIP